MHDISDFLDAVARKRFCWGTNDCLLVLADWVVQRRGADPAAQWRGRYETERECLRFIAEAGGMEAIMQRGLSSIGVERVDEAVAGDVGLLQAPGLKRGRPLMVLAGALAVPGGRWALFTVDLGLVIAPCREAVAVWRI